jgi:16S rRNA (cytosine1402-N4)-methyltransferase
LHEPGAWGHAPVLRDEVVDLLAPRPGSVVLDGTLGRGGHAEAFLQAGAQVLGLDRDPDALAACSARLSAWTGGGALTLHHATFDRAADILAGRRVDGAFLDLGVSSPQLDTPARGFSFRADGPLDMRMDPTHGETAAELLDRLDETGLADLLWRYGEERQSRRIARMVVAARPLRSTGALATLCARALPQERRIHPATRTFQALRIAVNDELGQLERALQVLPECLAPGGRLAILSFHSLEDRMVKQRFRTLAGEDGPRDLRGRPLVPPRHRLVERRARKGEELDPNPRARSARLRVLERLP